MDTDIKGEEIQLTSRILILIIEKCLDYLQTWSNIDMGLIWYGEDGQFGLGMLSLRYDLYIQVKISCRHLEIQYKSPGEIQIHRCSS